MDTALNHEERCILARLVMETLDDWQIDPGDQLALLGLPEGTRTRELTRLRGGAPFPDDTLQVSRARHILGIQSSLHMIFPHNRNMPAFWLHHGNRYFPDSPLSVMIDDGLPGMHRVWSHLDCTQNWD